MGISIRIPDQLYPGSVAFLAVLRLDWFNAAAPHEHVAHAEAHLRLAYAFDDASRQLEPAEARAFAEGLAMANAWPYLRLRIQMICQELGIAAFLLPLRPVPFAAPTPETQEP